MIDGKKRSIPGIIDSHISSYPGPFIITTKYTIQRKDVDPDAPYTIFTVGNIDATPTGKPAPYIRYETNLYIYWDAEGMAEAPNVSFVYNEASQKMMLWGVDSTMEYRDRSDSVWLPCTDTPMYFDCSSKETVYLVRYAGTGDREPSQSQEIRLPALRTAPGVSYNSSTEILSGLADTMEICINDGAYKDVTEDSMVVSELIDTIPSESTATISIRYKATATQQAGAQKVITLYPRSAQPSTLALDPITLTLSGGTSAMEYRGDTDQAWKKLSSSALSLQSYAQPDRDVKIYVRVRATSTLAASKTVEFTILQLSAAPTGKLDYTNEAIVELANGNYQYSKNGTSWTLLTVTDNQWNISGLIGSSAATLYLRWAATDTTPISAAAAFPIPARLPAPRTPAFDYSVTGQAALTGMTADMQYMSAADSEWTDITADQEIIFKIPDSAVKYYIRIKPNDRSFASANQTLTLLKAGSVPSCSYNTVSEVISSLSNKMEMKIGDGTYTPVSETVFSTTDLIDTLSAGDSLVICVRTMAVQTAPASMDRIVTLYARSEAPSTLEYDFAANAVNGCTSDMQYQLAGETTWRSISRPVLVLQSFAGAEQDVTVYVRMKPTNTAAASKTVQFVIPQMLPGPNGTVDCLREAVTELPDVGYQYSTNRSSWIDAAVTDGVWDLSSLLSTSARTVYLRYAATDTAPVSSYTTFSLSARPKAPASPVFVYNDPDHPDQAVLTGISSAMQYREKTETEWTDITEEQMVFEVPDIATTYYIRSNSTTDNWASANRTVTLARRASAPSCSYNASTESITKVRNTMEISVDGAPYESIESGTTYSVADLLDSLSRDETIEIKIRVKATATAPASKDKILTIGARVERMDAEEIEAKEAEIVEAETEEVKTEETAAEEAETEKPKAEEAEAEEIKAQETGTKETETKEAETEEVETQETELLEADIQESGTPEAGMQESGESESAPSKINAT